MFLVKNIDYFIMDPPQNRKITIDEISPAFIEYYYIIETVVGFGKQSL